MGSKTARFILERFVAAKIVIAVTASEAGQKVNIDSRTRAASTPVRLARKSLTFAFRPKKDCEYSSKAPYHTITRRVHQTVDFFHLTFV